MGLGTGARSRLRVLATEHPNGVLFNHPDGSLTWRTGAFSAESGDTSALAPCKWHEFNDEQLVVPVAQSSEIGSHESRPIDFRLGLYKVLLGVQ